MRNKNTANDIFFNLVPSTAFRFFSRRSLCDDYDGIIAPFTRQFTSSSSHPKTATGGHGFQLGELFAASVEDEEVNATLSLSIGRTAPPVPLLLLASSTLRPRLCSFSRQSDRFGIKITEKANEYLELLGEKLERWADDEIEEDVECDYSDGVLTISLGRERGTYVLNKQAPNKQIWWSSPISGPHRFEEDGARWADARRGQDGDDCLDDLETKLRKEWGEIFKGKKGLDL